jgi:hypothetical protein
MARTRTTTRIVSTVAAVAAVAAIAAIGAAPALAGQFMCIPDTAGAAVTSGGTTGTCSSGTTVKVPASAADQQTLIDLLPYVSIRATGIANKPTVVFKGVNVQLVKRDDTSLSASDGTGNLVIGRDSNPFGYMRTGSENVVVGPGHGWQTNGNMLIGAYNNAEGGSGGFVSGSSNRLIAGYGSAILGGFNNATRANYNAIVGGRSRITTTQYQFLADDVHWARYDSTGKVVASSEPTSTMSAYGSPYYSLTSWSGVDIAKCGLSAQVEGPDAQLTTAVASPYITSPYSYAYVRFNKPASSTSTTANLATNIPHTVIAVCGRTN